METANLASSPVRGLEPRHYSLPRLPALTDQITLCDGPYNQIAVRAPYTGEIVGTIPAAGAGDVELAVQHARAAQPAWAALSFADRAKIFLRFYDLLIERHEEALDLIQLETGKARCHAHEEILDTAIVSRYYALCAERCCARAAGKVRSHC